MQYHNRKRHHRISKPHGNVHPSKASRTPYSSASSTSPHRHPPLHLSNPKNSSSAPPPVFHSLSHPHYRRRYSKLPKGLCIRSRILHLGDAGTALTKTEEEGGGWKLRMDLRRMGWRRYAVVAAVLEGRMLRVVVVVVIVFVEVVVAMAAGVLVCGLAVVGSAFAPSRRLS